MDRVVTMAETYLSKGNNQRNMGTNGPDKWVNPDFQNFINTEIIGAKLQT